MHFKHFWVPCLHIIFFTSRLECSRKLNEKMKWNSGIPAGIPAAAGIPVRWHPCLVGFQNSRFEQTGLKISTHVTGESPVTWGVTLSPTWFEWRKVLIRRDWNPLIKNAEKKVLFGSNVVFQKGAKWSKYRFFMLLLLRILVGNIFYMLSDSNLLKNILIRQISSHRWKL